MHKLVSPGKIKVKQYGRIDVKLSRLTRDIAIFLYHFYGGFAKWTVGGVIQTTVQTRAAERVAAWGGDGLVQVSVAKRTFKIIHFIIL